MPSSVVAVFDSSDDNLAGGRPVIVTTTNPGEVRVLPGAEDVIAVGKPYAFDGLLAALERALSRKPCREKGS